MPQIPNDTSLQASEQISKLPTVAKVMHRQKRRTPGMSGDVLGLEL